MSVITKYGKTFVVLINTLFGLMGLVFLVTGLFTKYGSEYVDRYGDKLLDQVKDKLPDEIGNNLENFKISQFLGGAATAFILVGVVLIALVVWAYCGTCCQSKWMLIVYAVLLTLIFLGEATAGILFATKRSMIDEKIKQQLKDSLTKFYEGSTSQSAVSLGWNVIMGLLQCCGVDGPSDFEKTHSWNHTLDAKLYTSHIDVGKVVSPALYKLAAPLLCTEDKESTIQYVMNGHVSDIAYIQTGCYDAIWGEIEQHKGIAIGVAVGVGVLEMMLWIFTVCIIRDLGKCSKNKVGPMTD